MALELVPITVFTDSEQEAIRAHMAAVLASRPFVSAKRLRLFLTFIVEKALLGQGADIKEYVIATEVYERASDYDPQVDSTVRVEASRLRTKLREYYASEGLQASLRIELPKGSYVPVFQSVPLAQQQPVPTVLPQISVSDSAMARYLRPRAAVAAVLLLCVGLLAWQWRVRRAGPSRQTGAVETAILPGTSAPHSVSTLQNPVLLTQYLHADQLLRRPVLEEGWSGNLPASVEESIAAFDGLTKRAPSFAKAWVGLAEAQEWAYELDKEHPRSRLQAARAAAEHAIALDPNLAEAHSRLAAICLYGFGDAVRAEQASRRAIELNPRGVRSPSPVR